jgi:YVTN family beta-propeller protein
VDDCGATISCGGCGSGQTCNAGVCGAPPARLLWSANMAQNTVQAVDPKGGVVATIPVGSSPQWLRITPDGSKVYVANDASNTVSVISASTLAVTATVSVAADPESLDITPDGARVYVADDAGSVISTATDTVTTSLIGAHYFVIRPDGKQLWALSGYCPWCAPKTGSFSGDTFRVYSIPEHTELYGSGFADGITGAYFQFMPDGSVLWANNGCGGCGNVQRWSGTSYGKLSDLRWGNAGSNGLVLSPDASTLYTGHNGNTLARLRASDSSVLSQASFSNLGTGLAVAPDGSELYAGSTSGTILVLDPTSLATLREIPLGGGVSQYLAIH